MEKQESKKREVTWRAAEHEYVPKDVSWYWLIGTIAAVLILLALWQKNFFFFIFLLIATPMLFFFGRRRPSVLTFTVTEKGIGIGRGAFYKYADLEGFHVREREGGLDEIILKKRTAIHPYLKVPIDAATRREVERVFEKELKRVRYEESFLDIVAEWFGL